MAKNTKDLFNSDWTDDKSRKTDSNSTNNTKDGVFTNANTNTKNNNDGEDNYDKNSIYINNENTHTGKETNNNTYTKNNNDGENNDNYDKNNTYINNENTHTGKEINNNTYTKNNNDGENNDNYDKNNTYINNENTHTGKETNNNTYTKNNNDKENNDNSDKNSTYINNENTDIGNEINGNIDAGKIVSVDNHDYDDNNDTPFIDENPYTGIETNENIDTNVINTRADYNIDKNNSNLENGNTHTDKETDNNTYTKNTSYVGNIYNNNNNKQFQNESNNSAAIPTTDRFPERRLLNNPQLFDELKSFILSREGKYNYFYCDRRGLVTIGIGLLVDSGNGNRAIGRSIATNLQSRYGFIINNRPVSISEVLSAWESVKNYGVNNPRQPARVYADVAQVRINNTAIINMLDDKIRSFIDALYSHHPFMASMPEKIQMAIIDVRFNAAGVPLYGPGMNDFWDCLDFSSNNYNLNRALEIFINKWRNRATQRYQERHATRVDWFTQGVREILHQ